MTFMLIAVIFMGLMTYFAFILPERRQDKSFGLRDLPGLLQKPEVGSVYLITVLFATAYYTTYSYIEPFLKEVAGFSPQMITEALVLLGVCGFLGSVIFSRLYGRMRKDLIRTGPYWYLYSVVSMGNCSFSMVVDAGSMHDAWRVLYIV